MNSSELESAWRENVVKRRRSDETASLKPNFLSPTMNVSVTPRNRANLRRLKTNSLQSFKRWEKENELLYAMIEDLSEWLKKLFDDVVMTPEFFFFALEDGSLLCRLANYIQDKVNVYGIREGVPVAGKAFRYNTPLKKGTKEQKLFRSRENVQLYLTWCRSHSFPEAILFESNDVVEVDECREGGREIVICLMELARRFKKYNLDEVPQLIQMEQEIDQEEQEHDPNEEGQLLNTQPVEATSPTSIDSDSGVDSVFDEDNPANRISEFSADATDGANEKKNPVQARSELPSLLDSTGPKSQLDEQVCKIAKDYDIKVVQRLKEGKYIILGKIMFVRMLNDHLLLRIGGGWDTLEHYLMTHVPKPGVDTCTPLPKGASPRASCNSVKSRARLFEAGKTNVPTPRRNHTQEPPLVVVSKAPAESLESPPKDDKARRRLSELQKDERDISEAIRKISSTVLSQKPPNFANKTFFLLKKRFEKGGLFSKVRRRDSEPILGDSKLWKQMAETGSIEALAHPKQEINANEVGEVKENGDVSPPEIFVQAKVADTSSGDEMNSGTPAEVTTSDTAPLIDVTPDGGLGDTGAGETNQRQESDAQEFISFDEQKPNLEAPVAENDLVALERHDPAEESATGIEDGSAEPKNENHPESEGDQSAKQAEQIQGEPAVAPVKNDDEEQAGAKADSSGKPKEKEEVTKKDNKVEKKAEELKKGVAKTGAVEAAKSKPKATVAGRPKSPTKLPAKTEPKTAAKKENGAKSAAAKAPGAARKPEAKKVDERPKSAASRPATAKKQPSAASAKPAPARASAAPKKPAGAAPKPAAAVAPRKTAPTTRPASGTGTAPKKPAAPKPQSTGAAAPAPGRARPQSAKPGAKPTDKTDGQVAGKPARPQSAVAKPRAAPSTQKPATAGGLAKPKASTTTVSRASDAKTAKASSTAKSGKPDPGAKKAAEIKPTPRPGSAKPGIPRASGLTKAPAAQKPSSAATKPKVGGVKAPAQKGKETKPVGSPANKKAAAKKEKPAAATATEKPSVTNTEPKPALSEAVPSPESPPPSEGVVREQKSESVDVEGDVVVRTVVTTRETVGPEGGTQITTTTDKFMEQTVVQEVSAPEATKEADENSPEHPGDTSDEQQTSPELVLSGDLPTESEAVEGKAEESFPETPADTSEDQRSSPEPVPTGESPTRGDPEEGYPENPFDRDEDQQSSPEPVPREETPTDPEVVESSPDESVPENTNEDQRISPEPIPRQESPDEAQVFEGSHDENVSENSVDTSEDRPSLPEPMPRGETPTETEAAKDDENVSENLVDTTEDQPSSPEPMPRGETPTETEAAKDDENVSENLVDTTEDRPSSPEQMPRGETPTETEAAKDDENVSESLVDTSEDQPSSPEPMPREEKPTETEAAKDDENISDIPDRTDEDQHIALDEGSPEANEMFETMAAGGDVPTTGNLLDLGEETQTVAEQDDGAP